MKAGNILHKLFAVGLLTCSAFAVANAQSSRHSDDEFGPNVRAYLGYLRNEQEVVDDRASRREIKRSYYLHNLNRINALRQMAIHMARETKNDYLPELEAVSENELDQLFDDPLPKVSDFKAGELFEYKLRFLGTVQSRTEKFYIFARLDPYEQTELRKKAETEGQTGTHTDGHTETPPASNVVGARPRRVNIP